MKLKKSDQQQLWAEAQQRCRLSDEAVRMAKELGMGPRGLIKNIPAPTQQWKAPVEDWVRDLYEKRQRKAARKKRGAGQRTEFKAAEADAADLARGLTALANSGGGTLLLGVGDDGSVLGLWYAQPPGIARN